MNLSQVVILVLFAGLTQAAAFGSLKQNQEEEPIQNELNEEDAELSLINDVNDMEAPRLDDAGTVSTDAPETDDIGKIETRPQDVDVNEEAGSISSIIKLGPFSRPFYIQIVDKEVFVTEYGTSNIIVLNLYGKVLRKLRIPVGRPTGIFVKGNKVLVTNHKREIYSLSTSGELLGVQYSNEPVGVAVDQNDIMYATEWRSGRIQVFNRDGTKSHSISLGKAGYLRKIQFDKQGNLYVGEHSSRKVFVYNKCGKLIRQISTPSIVYMEGIHINGDKLYVADRRHNHGKVVVMSINTGRVIKIIHGLVGASDVAVAPDGRLWVVDFIGNAIKVYSF